MKIKKKKFYSLEDMHINMYMIKVKKSPPSRPRYLSKKHCFLHNLQMAFYFFMAKFCPAYGPETSPPVLFCLLCESEKKSCFSEG